MSAGLPALLLFQFTLPCRERQSAGAAECKALAFQFTLPCRERPMKRDGSGSLAQFQFTLPCRERRDRLDPLTPQPKVSIHAPV